MAGAGLIVASRGALSGLSLFPTPNAAPHQISKAQKDVLAAKRNRSLGTALSQIDAQTVRAWVDRWTKPENAARRDGTRLVRINAEFLAHYHPAWRLADALERGTISPLAPQIAQAMDAEDNFAAFHAPRNALTTSPAFETVRVLPSLTLREKSGISAIETRQNAALERFFHSVAARDALRGRDEVSLARRALSDAIAAGQNGTVAELNLSLLSPEVALELTNLRLQLLQNLSKTPAQRAAAREEIRVIEARITQIWREETARQGARLRAARVEIPAQNRSAGEAKIARDMEKERQSRAATRRAVARETRAKERSDFQSQDTLRLNLPASNTLFKPQFSADSPLAHRFSTAAPQFFETATGGAASKAPTPNWGNAARNRTADSVLLKSSSALVAALRRKARSQAQQWASAVVGNLGARRSTLPSAPDATKAAVEILFPAATH